MNPLPRFLALTLFVTLAALVALLTPAAWSGARAGGIVREEAPGGPDSNRLAVFSRQVSLGLAVVSAALALTLLVSLVVRGPRAADSVVPFAAARHQIDTLAKLAETSVAQGAELTRERDVRRRAEEDGQLKQRLLAQSFDERIRLGRDLHDGMIQSLYAVGLTLESVRALIKSDPIEADRRLEQIRASLNETIRDVRTYITGLAPDTLRQAGFSQAVDALLQELGAGREAQFEIKIDEEASGLLTPEQSVEALQIAREAVSNALRHGGATRITVRVLQNDREVCLLVQDNGKGFDPSSRREGGHGLSNMQARAQRLGADFKITSRPGEGARVLATFPV